MAAQEIGLIGSFSPVRQPVQKFMMLTDDDYKMHTINSPTVWPFNIIQVILDDALARLIHFIMC